MEKLAERKAGELLHEMKESGERAAGNGRPGQVSVSQSRDTIQLADLGITPDQSSKMNRRDFLQLATMALAGAGMKRAWPFRVFSFPKEIKIFSAFDPLKHVGAELRPEMLRRLIIETTPTGQEPSWVQRCFLDPDCLYGLRAADIDLPATGPFMNIKRTLWPTVEVSREELRRMYPEHKA